MSSGTTSLVEPFGLFTEGLRNSTNVRICASKRKFAVMRLARSNRVSEPTPAGVEDDSSWVGLVERHDLQGRPVRITSQVCHQRPELIRHPGGDAEPTITRRHASSPRDVERQILGSGTLQRYAGARRLYRLLLGDHRERSARRRPACRPVGSRLARPGPLSRRRLQCRPPECRDAHDLPAEARAIAQGTHRGGRQAPSPSTP